MFSKDKFRTSKSLPLLSGASARAYDRSELNLGVYYSVAVSAMEAEPENQYWGTVLKQMDDSLLFLLAIKSIRLCDVVADHTATGTVLSGDAVTSLLEYEHSAGWDDLYFLVPEDSYSLALRFFDVATAYLALPLTFTHPLEGVSCATRLFNPTSKKSVFLMRALTNSALDCLTHQHFTHLMMGIAAWGVWLSNPVATSQRLSIPNKGVSEFVGWYLTCNGAKRVIQRDADKYRFVFSLHRKHRCGVTFECPATLRSTDDRGCLTLLFGSPARPTTGKSGSPMSWSLEGTKCPFPGNTFRQRVDGHAHWQARMEGFILNIAVATVLRDIESRA
ncbi:hypothetical protein C8R47DRAFT_1228456 [Mycena vitilis]|nr:hypothetical protein C8R47DRAFT_1228456 [Mycena vitilis]